MSLYGNMDLDAQTVIWLHDSGREDEVRITLGVLDDPEQLTVRADDPDVLDRLTEVVSRGARVLRAKRSEAGRGG